MKFLPLFMSLLFISAISCTHYQSGKNVQKNRAETPKIKTEQMDFATLEFDRGEIQLSEMDRRHLNELAAKISDSGKIVDDIKILTWSDRATKKDIDATNTEIILARQRAEAIKNYFENNLKAEEDIDFYNMAENPERFTRYLERKGVSFQEAFKAEGPDTRPDGRALVIIEYQMAPASSVL